MQGSCRRLASAMTLKEEDDEKLNVYLTLHFRISKVKYHLRFCISEFI